MVDHCRTCGATLELDWLDNYCAGCLDRVYEDLATQLEAAFLASYWGDLIHQRLPAGETRWWMRSA
jgi:hypothetical protein